MLFSLAVSLKRNVLRNFPLNPVLLRRKPMNRCMLVKARIVATGGPREQ